MRRLAACLIACLAALTGGVVVAPSAAAADRIQYVALGDSFSAGSALLPLDLRDPLCLSSYRNYPHLIAGRTGAQLTDVTCGAAETRHFATSQYPGVAPQLDALNADTDVVTLTIGGNDSMVFINALLTCIVAAVPTVGQGSPCADSNGTRFVDTINNVTRPALVAALGAVRDRAPNAEIAVLGYPRLLPEADGCYPRMPIARGDVTYLNGIQSALNTAISDAARQTGVTFVDMDAVSRGHDACQRLGVRWIEPVVLGTNIAIVHPNGLGQVAMAGQALRALARV